MEESKQRAKQFVASSASSGCSKLKLGWLILLTCTGIMIYCYFEFYFSTNSGTTIIFYHHQQQQPHQQQPHQQQHQQQQQQQYPDTTRDDDDIDFLMANDTTGFDDDQRYKISTGEFGVVFADHSEDEEESDLKDDEGGDEDDDDEEDTGNSTNSGNFTNEIEDDLWSNDNMQKNESQVDIDQNQRATRISPKDKIYGEVMMRHIERGVTHNNSHCSVRSLFRSWQNGIITQLGGQPLKRDCRRLRKNPSKEIKTSKLSSQLKAWKSEKPWEAFAMRYKTMKCEEMRKEFEDNFYVSQMEKEFPIAYIFVVYTNAGQVLRLLKSIYRPHNLYCIHPDARQGRGFKLFFEAVAKCLDNVFVVSKPVRVYYGHISITEAQLHCMNDLEQYPVARWRYVINLCGREIPIKTNREIVQSLIKLKGYSALNLHYLTPTFWTQRFKYKYRLLSGRGVNIMTRKRQKSPPPGIRLYKSMNFFAASRKFVDFLLHDSLSKKLLRYLGSVYAPEEHFYSSLYASPQARGGRPPSGLMGKVDTPIVDQFIWVNNQWQTKHRKKYCPGRHIVHGICILTSPDLANIERLAVNSREPVFFFNKYFMEWDPTPMDCMEERLVQNNMNEFRRDCLLQSSTSQTIV